MPRSLKRHENEKRAKARRAFALHRPEMGQPSEPRVAAAGPTAMAVKINPDAAAIEEFLAKRGAGK